VSVIIINKKDAYTAGALSGATFGIYSDVTCTDASLVTTLTTGADGSVRSGDLPAGTYYIRETIAPDGFVITEETKQVTIGWAVPEVEVEFTNERSPGKIVITKTDSLTGATMAGVTFDIFSDANCTNLIESIVTNSNGVAESSLLTYGTYYIKESGVVAGYQANTTVYSATVGYKITSVSVAVENIPNNGVIKVNKTDSLTGDVIQGVVFDIYTDANCTNLVERITTGANGVATSSPLTPKTYYVKEISTVNGFILSTEVKSATVGYTVTEVTLDFENTPQNGKVTITKTDSLTGDRIEALYLESTQMRTVLI